MYYDQLDMFDLAEKSCRILVSVKVRRQDLGRIVNRCVNHSILRSSHCLSNVTCLLSLSLTDSVCLVIDRIYQSSSCFLPCMAACLCLSASASPPAILPLLSLALSIVLPPLPLYPLSRAESPLTAFLAAGRLAGGAGGFGLPPAAPLIGRAGGAGGGGGAATRWTTSSR